MSACDAYQVEAGPETGHEVETRLWARGHQYLVTSCALTRTSVMTEPLDISALPVDGCFFLRKRMSAPADFSGTSPGAYKHVYTYWGSAGPSARARGHDLRRQAENLHCQPCSATPRCWTPGAAQPLMGGVYVITQLDERRLIQGLQELADSGDPGEKTAAPMPSRPRRSGSTG